MRMTSELEVEMSYYNERLAVWEPLLEPIMEREDHFRPWTVFMKVRIESKDRTRLKMDEIDQMESSASTKQEKEINAQRQQGMICDFIIKAYGEEFPVHRHVMAGSSEYFRTTMMATMTEGHINHSYLTPQKTFPTFQS